MFDSRLRFVTRLWADISIDNDFGGYLTCRNRDFSLSGTEKGAWGQGRQIFTFATMAEYDPQNRQFWLDCSKKGVEFVVNHMLTTDGRVNYLVNRDGTQILEGPISIFSDAFVISGISEYIRISHQNDLLPLLEKMFLIYLNNVLNPEFPFIAPNAYQKGVLYHSVFMIAVNTAYIVQKLLGKEKTDSFISNCLNRIFSTMFNTDTGSVFEKKNFDGSLVDTEDRQLINVGHVFESMWFCYDIALSRHDSAMINKIISITESTYSLGVKSGILDFSYDASNILTKTTTWKYEISFDHNDRISWAFAEAMVLFAKLYQYTNKVIWFERMEILSDYVEQFFWDKQYGDWYHALNGDGSIKIDMKGSTVKNAYHIPRAYMQLIESLKGILRGFDNAEKR